MIPQRIAVRGFLCYREEQEICFDSAALWMLAGLNGSGKSAVFDGVTYALFGGHRAGQQHADELINKNCDSATVEFEFLLDRVRHRARRTLRRKATGGAAPTQQLARWEVGENGEGGHWQPIQGTSNKRDFDAWVRENIGLTYETFTSSVLLMQGRAEKLLAAVPKERFEVLASIVDLDRYQRLHERADEQRRRLKEQVELVQLRLDEVAEVTAAEVEEANQRIAAARAEVEQRQAEVERLHRLEVLAERWADIQGKLSEARRRWQEAQRLVAAAAEIERDWQRLSELRDVLPHLQALSQQRERLTTSERRCEALDAEQRTLAARLGEVATILEETRQKQLGLQQGIADDQQREQTLGHRLRELSALLTRVSLWERQLQEVSRLDTELADLPADPAAAVAAAEQEYDQLQTVSLAVPLLRRFHAEREEIWQARTRKRSAEEEEATLRGNGEALAEECKALGERLKTATEERQQADERATQLRTLLDHARDELKQLNEVSGAKRCRFCGQELTPGHMEVERSRREKARAAADADSRTAADARKQATQAERTLLDLKQAKEEALAEMRERFKDCRRQQADADRDAQRHAAECARIHAEVPDAFRGRIHSEAVADWLTTVYPTATDLAAAEEEAQGKADARRRLQQARAVEERWKNLRVQRDTVVRALKAQEADLPADGAEVRQEHERLVIDENAIKELLKTKRTQAKEVQDALEKLHREHKVVSEQLSEKGQQWSAEEVRRDECRKAVERTRLLLPPEWQARADTATAADVRAWQVEQRALEEKGVPAKAGELTQARANLEALAARCRELEEEAASVPEEARFDPAQLKARVATARQQQAKHESALLEAQKTADRLAERRDRRQELQKQHAALDRQHNLYRLLAELLGRNRLQLYLVRQAERGIVDYANAVLDRLSGGQLYLRLRGEEDTDGGDQALQLEAYNRSTGQAPIGVSFLSGSQRFRVAVSLALGIGQYASRQHRPIESVIIDEGFGCLDRQGRQVMIQELLNLRGQLRCILLVSHQEEFAEAFADGYKFELNNGTTQVTRFQR